MFGWRPQQQQQQQQAAREDEEDAPASKVGAAAGPRPWQGAAPAPERHRLHGWPSSTRGGATPRQAPRSTTRPSCWRRAPASACLAPAASRQPPSSSSSSSSSSRRRGAGRRRCRRLGAPASLVSAPGGSRRSARAAARRLPPAPCPLPPAHLRARVPVCPACSVSCSLARAAPPLLAATTAATAAAASHQRHIALPVQWQYGERPRVRQACLTSPPPPPARHPPGRAR
jgi:hypothetical protein